MAPSKAKQTPDTGHTRKAYQGIRHLLFHTEIVPGQKIAYRDLAERLGMSQTPVIQALKWLEFQGLVRHERHRGYYTEPVSIQEVEEIYDFRKQIELALLPRTMDRLDAVSIKELEAALNAHLKASREIYLHDRLLRDMEQHLPDALIGLARVAGIRRLFFFCGGLLFVLYSSEKRQAQYQSSGWSSGGQAMHSV